MSENSTKNLKSSRVSRAGGGPGKADKGGSKIFDGREFRSNSFAHLCIHGIISLIL